MELQLFLGRPLRAISSENTQNTPDYTKELIIGSLPRDLLEYDYEWHLNKLKESGDLSSLYEVAERAKRLVIKSKPKASSESYKRAKEFEATINVYDIVHPLLGNFVFNLIISECRT